MAEAARLVPDEEAPRLTAEEARQLHCYSCGNEDAYELLEFEEPVMVGGNIALVPIQAAVCRFCGTRLLDLPNQARLDKTRARLERGEVAGFEPVGITYHVPTTIDQGSEKKIDAQMPEAEPKRAGS